MFFAVGLNEQLDAVAVGKIVDGGCGPLRGVGHSLHVAFAPVDVVPHIDVFAAAAYSFVHFVLGVLQGNLHQRVGVVVFEQVLFLIVEVEIIDAGGVAFRWILPSCWFFCASARMSARVAASIQLLSLCRK